MDAGIDAFMSAHIILPALDPEPVPATLSRPILTGLLRGEMKSQCNIWCWPIGSGEVYGYRIDSKMPPEVRAGVTPKVRADNPVGEWNRFIIRMIGDRLTVSLNGQTVIENAQLPGVPKSGPIGFQHHGGKEKDGSYNNASALVQFRNVFIRKL